MEMDEGKGMVIGGRREDDAIAIKEGNTKIQNRENWSKSANSRTPEGKSVRDAEQEIESPESFRKRKRLIRKVCN